VLFFVVELYPLRDEEVLIHNMVSGQIFESVEIERQRLGHSDHSCEVLMLTGHPPDLVGMELLVFVPFSSRCLGIFDV